MKKKMGTSGHDLDILLPYPTREFRFLVCRDVQKTHGLRDDQLVTLVKEVDKSLNQT